MKLRLFAILLIALVACNNNAFELENKTINGNAQKGPFILGSAIEIMELDQNLNQTGNIFKSEIKSDLGDFLFTGISLENSIALFEVNGFCRNEAYGVISNSPITLNAIADIKEKNDICVNILTHLEKDRVLHLIGENMSFIEAKAKSRSELLAIFEWDSTEMLNFEDLNIYNSDDNDAILLAVSVIFNNIFDMGEMMELIGRFKSDFSVDGVLDDTDVQTILMDNAILVERDLVRRNVNKWISDLGLTNDAPDFDKFLDQFIDGSPFGHTVPKHISDMVSFPEDNGYTNLWNMSGDTLFLESEKTYSINTVYNYDADIVGKVMFSNHNGSLDLTEYIGFNPNAMENWKYGVSSYEAGFYITQFKMPSKGLLTFKDHGGLKVSMALDDMSGMELKDIVFKKHILVW